MENGKEAIDAGVSWTSRSQAPDETAQSGMASLVGFFKAAQILIFYLKCTESHWE